ncbi:hypothetical protein C0J52_04616 [Blattella germanica]|nr:hypothetical protein C0J52_04616 [Blattella germanica]
MNIDKDTKVTDEWFPQISANKHYYLIGLWCQIGAILIVGPLTFLAILYILTTASTTVHDNMIDSMLFAPLKCLDTITLERILNAFSHDMKVLDEMIPPTLLELTQCIIMILGCILVIMISSYWLIIPTIVLVISACIVANVCLPSTRALKKIEDMSKPIQDCHSSALCLMKCATHALGLWIGLFSVLYTACITLGYRLLVPDLKPAHLGIATYCSLVLTTLVPEAVTYCAHAGMQLASAGRIMQLSQLEHEKLDASPSERKEGTSGLPPTDWPQNGEIQAKNLTLQYSQYKPCVLQNLNFTVKPREKVGVVGCVGAGKSALLSALLRMAEPLSGEALWIDEVDISKIPLRLLRSRISVVPRFPILFSGQLRFNLDPDSTLADNVLWDALDKESGHPYLLLQNEYSHFYKMVHQTGIAVKEQLIQLAREAYLGSITREEEEEEK